MRVLPGAFQTKPGAALARGQGWLPWQGRGWFPAPCLGRHPGVRDSPISHLVADGWVAARNRRRVDQRRGRLAVDEEAVEQRAQLVDRAQVHREVEAVLAGDPVALADLRDLRRQLRDARELPGRGLDAHDRRQLVAER